MPADALPIPQPVRLAGSVHYAREYRDAAGRPLSGKVTFTGQARTATDGRVVVPAPIPCSVIAGMLDVDLQPDTYTLAAELRTVEGVKVIDRETVTLTAS